MEIYDEIFRKYREYYFSLKPVQCKILGNSLVYFTNSGFNHIVRKKRKERNKKDQIRRLVLLGQVVSIIKQADTLFERRIIGNIVFWCIGKVNHPKIVLCKNTKGPIYFVSIIP